MRLYEFEGKELFKKVGILVPEGQVISREKDLENVDFPTILKAQLLSGSRGKAGLIKPARDIDEAKRNLKEILGKEIDGNKVEKVLAERYLVDKENEFSGYL